MRRTTVIEKNTLNVRKCKNLNLKKQILEKTKKQKKGFYIIFRRNDFAVFQLMILYYTRCLKICMLSDS